MSGYSSLSTELREQLRKEASHFADHEDVDSLMDYVEAVLLYGKDRDGMCQELSEILGEGTRYFVDRLYDLIDEMVQSNLPEQVSPRTEVNEEECLVSDDIEGQGVQDEQLKETDGPIKRKRLPIENEQVDEDSQEESFTRDIKRRDHRSIQQPTDKEVDKKSEKVGMNWKEKLKADVDARLKALQEKRKVQASKGKAEIGTNQESKFRYRYGKVSQQHAGDKCELESEKFKNGGRNYGYTKSLHYKSYGVDRSERARDAGNEHVSDDSLSSEKKDFLVKCKFFPACTNENCSYYHPTENCRKFPNCPLGQACMYIHPTIPCKFGAFCTRGAECPFMHYTRPNYLPPMYPIPNSILPCKNGFSCVTPRCTFSHPIEACRFGAACKNKFCTFSHARPCRNGSNCNIPGCTFAHGKFLIQPPEKETVEVTTSKGSPSSEQTSQYSDECGVDLNSHSLENNAVEIANEN